MQITEKDKSFILLIVTSLIILWSIFTAISYFFSFLSLHNSDIAKITSRSDIEWINTSNPITLNNVKHRIVLLSFWNEKCLECSESIIQINNLKKKIGNKLAVIGVYSSNSESEKNIKAKILELGFNYPTAHDSKSKITKKFNIDNFPTIVLVNPEGNIEEKFKGNINFNEVEKKVSQLIEKFEDIISSESGVSTDSYQKEQNILKLPKKLAYGQNLKYKNKTTPVIFVADSGNNRIVVSSLAGEIIATIGSGYTGLQDGNFSESSFNSPQSMIFKSNKLYVADKGNHALRVIDFSTEKVSTLIGDGKSGEIIKESQNKNLKKPRLSLPTGLTFVNDKNQNKGKIAIANSGTNQILLFDINKKTLSVLAGNGLIGSDDGKYPNNSLSEPSALSYYSDTIYFLDRSSSSLRSISKEGKVETLLSAESSSLLHPSDLIVDDTGIYIVDTFNNTIKKYDHSDKKISVISINGSDSKIQLNKPRGIISILDRFYIADTNNNRVISASRIERKDAEILDILPPLKLNEENISEYYPTGDRSQNNEVSSNSPISVRLNINSGWKINENAPSFINLIEVLNRNQANLIDNFNWVAINSGEIKLPNLQNNKSYILQGTIYYCEDKKNALCYIKNIDHALIATDKSKATEIELNINE